MPRAPRFAPGGSVDHALKRAAARWPRFEKAGDFAAFQRGLVEAQARHERQAKAKTAHDKTAWERQIAATDRQIVRPVYELYGLTEAAIKIVEEATGA